MRRIRCTKQDMQRRLNVKQLAILIWIKAIVLNFSATCEKNVLCPYLDKRIKLCCELYPNLWYMRNLHLAPKFEKIYFYTTENFGVKNKNPEKTRNTKSLFGKNILAFVFFDIMKYV